jgi:catechol 2,3-dioxygenase-like lactoylglutathione lyase family enzyme
VSDLDRSAAFYQAVLNVREEMREDQLAVLVGDQVGSLTVYLRQANRNASRPGQQALGVRSLACDVGSLDELARIEARLQELDALTDRLHLHDDEKFDVVRGHDPDRLPLTFVANESGGPMSPEDYHRAMLMMYVVDI